MLLDGADGVFGGDGILCGAGADFDENEGVFVSGEEIDFVGAEVEVAVENAVAVFFEEAGGEFFSLLADGLAG